MLPATPQFLALIHAADPRPFATAPGQLGEPSERWRPLLGGVAKHDPGRLHHCGVFISHSNTTPPLAPETRVWRRLNRPKARYRRHGSPRGWCAADNRVLVRADVTTTGT